MPNEPITTKIITHKLTPWQIQNCDLYTPFSGSAIELVILTGHGYHAEIRQRPTQSLDRPSPWTDPVYGPAQFMDLVKPKKGGKVKMFRLLKSQIQSVKKTNGSMKRIAMESKFHGPKVLVVHLE